MGLYDSVPDSFSGRAAAQTGRAFESMPGLQQQKLQAEGMAQQNTDQAYNSPAREANTHEQGIGNYIKSLFGNAPPEFVERLKSEMATPSLGQGAGAPASAQPAQTVQQGLQQPPEYGPSQQGAFTGGEAHPMYGPTSREQGFPTPNTYTGPGAPNGPQAMSGMSASAASGGYGLGASNPQPRTPPQQAMAAPPAPSFATSQPQRMPAKPGSPMTQGDVNKYMQMAPFASQQSRERIATSRPTGLTFQERLALQNNQGDQTRTTETVKQTGRMGLDQVRGTRQKLMKAAELALGQRQLDETTVRHIDQFNIDLAKLENMANFQDRLLGLKAGSARDELLNNGRQLVASLRNGQSGLIGSGFGGTPLGQQFLQSSEETIGEWETILSGYADGSRKPAGGGGGANVTSQSNSASTRTTGPKPTITPRKGQSAGPTKPSGPFKFRLKTDTDFGKKGDSGGSDDPMDYNPNTMELVQ